jgi:hypothetical protein
MQRAQRRLRLTRRTARLLVRGVPPVGLKVTLARTRDPAGAKEAPAVALVVAALALTWGARRTAAHDGEGQGSSSTID